MKKASVLLYVIGAIFIAGSLIYCVALVMVLRSWNWLRVFEVYPGTGYLIFKNLFFASGLLVAGFSLFLRRHWAPWLGTAFSLLLMGWFWLDRTILSQSPAPFSRQILIFILSLLLLALVLVSMWLLSSEMKEKPITSQPDKGQL